MVNLSGDTALLADFSNRDTLANGNLGFPLLADDLFQREVISAYLFLLFGGQISLLKKGCNS